jgi:prevent-host-death family protein
MEAYMKYFSATDAKNKFGEVMDELLKGPVGIQKNGRDFAVILSADEFKRITESTTMDPVLQTSLERSMGRWNKVYEALAK